MFCGNKDHATRHVGEPYGHTAVVTCLHFHGCRVYSGGMDNVVMCWDIEAEDRGLQRKDTVGL